MPSLVKLAHPAQRRVIADALPTPRVSLRVPREEDELDSARGVLSGALIGGAIWIGIVAWFIWN